MPVAHVDAPGRLHTCASQIGSVVCADAGAATMASAIPNVSVLNVHTLVKMRCRRQASVSGIQMSTQHAHGQVRHGLPRCGIQPAGPHESIGGARAIHPGPAVRDVLDPKKGFK